MGRRKNDLKAKLIGFVILSLIICFVGIFNSKNNPVEIGNNVIEQNASTNVNETVIDIENIPEYSGKPYISINGNVPYFEEHELTTESFEMYSQLDEFGRCSVAVASIGKDIMPKEDRGNIGSVKPTGWHTVKYDGIDGLYLYNRCHLIGYQLTGENANTGNLITGTRYMNVEGMLPFENMVADYVNETGNHVMYRVTPIFKAENLVASGVVMEAKSVEDDGEGILFNVYCYNVQPGIYIDYSTGESHVIKDTKNNTTLSDKDEVQSFVLNTNSNKFHSISCDSIDTISAKNRQEFIGTRDEIIEMKYSPCGNCKP